MKEKYPALKRMEKTSAFRMEYLRMQTIGSFGLIEHEIKRGNLKEALKDLNKSRELFEESIKWLEKGVALEKVM